MLEENNKVLQHLNVKLQREVEDLRFQLKYFQKHGITNLKVKDKILYEVY